MIDLTHNYKHLLLRHKLLTIALIISIMLHALFIIEFALNFPLWDEADDEVKTLLEARLVKLKTPEAQLSPVEQKIPKEQAKKPKAKTAAPPSQSPSPSAETVNDHVTPQAEFSTLNAATLNTQTPEADVGMHDGDSDTAAAAEIMQDTEAKKTLYSHVETEFEVKRGANTSAAGITKIVFDISNNGTYSILSQTEAKGLASLFFGNLVQKSEGSVTALGLKPHFYSYQYGSDAKKLQTATFHWNDNVLKLHSSKGERSVPLPQGTQDFLSFMYQFMFSPPLENMQITMTNGKKLGTYEYSFEGEESLHTRSGMLNTIHLLRSSDDEEKTEIWLATDYQYLPVRIVKTEKDGTVIEQVVTNLSTRFANE